MKCNIGITEDGDNHRVKKYRNVSLTNIPSTSGVIVLKKVECVGKNDCEHVENCNIACTAAFIKHFCYTALLMGH